ncbi:hypothetical protein HGRIS_013165 [Hohenbuehelia grisea]|uniref:Voltage-gated hydrogen channel 1 n=1 Tax=Hohenbuehelia grisea TaxID=104357 RepID=A0ABR3IUV9_9AGAR
MSEEQPLLLDAESGTGNNNWDDVRHTERTWRGRTRELLESQPLHKSVLALIVVDAACVLADLGYTFLSDSCSPELDLPLWLEVLANISLTITTLFLIEIPLALWAFGARYFNPFGSVIHASLHLFDAMVIATTFILEVVLRGRERELAGLLVVLRLWRLVKLVGGITVGAGEIGEEDAKELAQIRQQLSASRSELAAIRSENQELRRRLGTLEQSTSD